MSLEQFARDTLERCRATLAASGRFTVDPVEFTVRTDLRGKSRAGMACWRERYMRLSPEYFAALGERYADTIAHEYAHLVVRAEEEARGLRRGPSHGPRWRAVMRSLGVEASRCLTDEERARAAGVQYARKARKFLYGCAAGHTHAVGIIRHRKLQSGVRYMCRAGACAYARLPITFVKEVTP